MRLIIRSLILLSVFISVPAFSADFFGTKRKALQVDILTFAATLKVTADGAAVGAVWSREGRKSADDTTIFETKARISGSVSSGNAAFGESVQSASELASKTVNSLNPFITPVSGQSLANEIAYGFDWENLIDKTVKAGRSAVNAGTTADEVGPVVSLASWEHIAEIQAGIEKAIAAKVGSRHLANDVDFNLVLIKLKEPIGTAAFQKVIPEIRDFYIESVDSLQQRMIELDLLN